MKRVLAIRAVFAAAAVLAFAASWTGFRTYYTRYYFVKATRGTMNETEHARRLERAVRYDPGNGTAHLSRTDYLMKKGRIEEARDSLDQAMKSARPGHAYLLRGALLERLKKPEEARKAYEHVLTVAPGQVTAMERLAVLAYEANDLKKVEQLAARIARADLNNPNPPYLRAIAAERSGDGRKAFLNYQRISAAGQPSSRAIFQLEEVRARLENLGPGSKSF